jgi:hypothetical protein
MWLHLIVLLQHKTKTLFMHFLWAHCCFVFYSKVTLTNVQQFLKICYYTRLDNSSDTFFSPHRPRFNPRWLEVDGLALKQVYSEIFWFPLLIIIPPFFHTHLSQPPKMWDSLDKAPFYHTNSGFVSELPLCWAQSKVSSVWLLYRLRTLCEVSQMSLLLASVYTFIVSTSDKKWSSTQVDWSVTWCSYQISWKLVSCSRH